MHRILMVADAKLPVPPIGYGGTERMLAHIAAELSDRGHEVTLMGNALSRINGRVVGYPWASGSKPARAAAKLVFMTRFRRELARRPDVVIANCRADYLAPMREGNVPLVYRFSFPFGPEHARGVADIAPSRYRIIAQARAHAAPIEGTEFPLAVVGNCVDLQHLRFAPRGGDYLAFLGRLTPNKGVDIAIQAARMTGSKLKIAGNVSDEPGDREYFMSLIAPNLSDQIEWIGEIDDRAKVGFLGGAKALLAPIRWPEPLANVVPESLACGTPVIASPYGSMPELIRTGANGYLATSADEFAAAISQLGEISREVCRADAEARFSRRLVGDGYLKVIQELINMS